MISALAGAAVASMGRETGPIPDWGPEMAHHSYGGSNRCRAAWYKGSRWAKRATARGGNPAAHGKAAHG